MLKKIILFIILHSMIFAASTSQTDYSIVTLAGVDPLTITANNNDLDFGENQIGAGVILKPIAPILLVVKGVYPKSISVRVPKEIDLLNNSKKIVFNSNLTGDKRDGVLKGKWVVWDSESEVLGGNPINLEFSGDILLTNLEEVGTYQGIATIEVEYN